MLIEAETSYAVLIGTSSHSEDSGLESLPAVRNNLADLHSALSNSLILGLPDDHITVIENPLSAASVTHAVRVAGEHSSISTLIVYYAGHGVPDDLSQLHLALACASNHEIPASWLPFDWLRRSIRTSLAPTRVLILDCCYAGLASSGSMSGGRALGEQSNIAGTWTLYSSPENQPSWAPPGERNTAFTGELVDVMRSGVPHAPAELDGDVLVDELRRRMRARSWPPPGQHNSDMGHRVALARNQSRSMNATTSSKATRIADAERAAMLVSVSVQWADPQVRRDDRLRDDEDYWVMYVRNSSAYPLQRMIVTAAAAHRICTVEFGAVEPGNRQVYILRPPDDDFPLDGPVPEATATFEVLGIGWRLENGRVRRFSPRPTGGHRARRRA